MNSTTVLGLQRLREYPSVSILVPVEPGPQLTEVDRLRIQRRIDDLARRLLGDVDAPTTVEVMERLQGLLTELTDQPVGRSVALFASPSTSISHQLHVEVRERTVVDDTFATRDLLDEARRTVAFVAATVSDRMVQAVEAQGDVIAPVKGRGVPLERLPDETDACWERRTVALLRRLGSGPLPLVLFGAGRRVATLVRSGGVEPAAVILGNHDRTPWATLADLARGPLADWAGARNATALHRLDQARGRRRYASGLDEIWSLAGESREPDQGEVSGTMPPDDGETQNPTPPGVERHPLYDHPRIAAVREAIHGIGVSNEYKTRLYHSLYAYADQVVTRPICAPGEGWSDLEAIQQVTMGDMNERWIRTNWFHSPCEPASGEDETTSHGHDGVTAQIGKHQEGTVETGVASSVLISPAYPTELEPVEPPKPPYPRLPDWGRPLINATTRGILSKEYVHACEYNYFVLRRTTPAPRSVKEASPEAQFLIAEAWEMLRSRGLDDSGRPLIRPR